MLKTQWRKESRRTPRVDYVDLGKTEVWVGRHFGSGHTDDAGVASFSEFLAGKYQDLVRRAHGEAVLAEVVAAVRARMAGEG